MFQETMYDDSQEKKASGITEQPSVAFWHVFGILVHSCYSKGCPMIDTRVNKLICKSQVVLLLAKLRNMTTLLFTR